MTLTYVVCLKRNVIKHFLHQFLLFFILSLYITKTKFMRFDKMDLHDAILKVNLTVEKLPFGDTEIVTAVTNADNSSEMCVYVDNGIYCIKLSFFDVDFDGKELLSNIDFDGLKLAFSDYGFNNHTKWCTPYWMIIELKQEYPEHYSGDLPDELNGMIMGLRKQLL